MCEGIYAYQNMYMRNMQISMYSNFNIYICTYVYTNVFIYLHFSGCPTARSVSSAPHAAVSRSEVQQTMKTASSDEADVPVALAGHP